MKRIVLTVLVIIITAMIIASMAEQASATEPKVGPLPVKVLLLPKFEVEEMSGDYPGEAQFYYEQYLTGAEEYDVPYSTAGLYYKDGIAMYITGMGKVNAALGTMAVLSDSRFDFSQAYIISTGCAGSAAGTTVMGDVFIITSVADYDLGHHADSREIADPDGKTWYHNERFDAAATVRLDPDLMKKVYELVKDTPIETTDRTRNYMRAAFDGADWAVRDPQVLRGTAVTSDSYWKGEYGHANALLIAETYQCPDPYAVTEMEDIAIALTAERMRLLDHLIIIRGSVNMDVFMLDATPENLWGDTETMKADDENSVASADIFATAMKNNFEVGRIIIDKILEGQF